MAILVSDAVLDELICDICEKYLSVLPIKVFPNHRSVCGRCTKKNPESNGTSSSYNIIAEKTLFKCVNRYDGCRELLRCSDVVEHEKVCLEKKYVCPICPELDEIPTFLLLKHFQNKHKDSVLKNPYFSCNLNTFSDVRNVYIYRSEDYLFYFYLILNRVENLVKVKVVFMGDEKLASFISYKFHINLLNENLKIDSNRFNCETYKNDNDGFFKINIKDFSTFVVIEVDLDSSERLVINDPKKEELKFLQNSNKLIQNNIKFLQTNSCLVVEGYFSNIGYLNLFENIKFTPITKSLTLRKLHLSSEFKEGNPGFSLTECEFGLVKENKVFFLVCINCNYGNFHLYVSKENKHSLCEICFNFLLKQNLIDEGDYKEYDSDNSLEYFCSCNCGQTFNFRNCLKHEWEMKKDKIKQKCFKCDEIYNLGQLFEHMKIKHAFNGRVETNYFVYLYEYAHIVFVEDQLIFVEIIEHSDTVDIHLHFNKNHEQNITGLLYEDTSKGINVLKFENFITVKPDCNYAYFFTLICS